MWNAENVCPLALRGAARELRRLAARPPAGVKLLLRPDDLTDVVALIDGPVDTPYAGGVFRVRLVLGREFPAAPPRAYFLTRIFHPNVAPGSGEVCVNTLRRDWRPELGLEHALLAVRCLLIAPNADSALNAEAAALLRDRYQDYFARAKLLSDIHARPLHAAAPDNRQESPAESSTGVEDGPCAKRERRPPVTAADSASAAPDGGPAPPRVPHPAGEGDAAAGDSTQGSAPGDAVVAAGNAVADAENAVGDAGSAVGDGGGTARAEGGRGTGAAGGTARAPPAPRSSKDKDRRRILKRL